MPSRIAKFREGLPFLDQKGLFLNYAATAPLTTSTVQAIQRTVSEMTEPLGQHFYEALNQLEFARREFAELIGASASEIAFTQNTSMALSTVAMSLDLKPGDRILVPDNEFPSNYYPWENLRSKGVICETFSTRESVSMVEILSQKNLEKVKLISLSHVSYETGKVMDLKGFAEFCRSRKIYSCVDAIQAIGAIPYDVHALGVDFLCSGAQKWLLGPIGCGLLYASKDVLPSLQVPFVGWTSVLYPEYMDLGPLEFSEDMTRFEPGLPNLLPVVGLKNSLSELKSVGWDFIFQKIQSNSKYLVDHLSTMGAQFLDSGGPKAGIVSFLTPGNLDHRRVEEEYAKKKIKITARKNYIRVSPHFFTLPSELDSFLSATEDLFGHSKRRMINIMDIADLPKNRIANPEASQSPILINGAAGNLGQEIARLFARQGHRLCLLDKNLPLLQQMQQELGSMVDVLELDLLRQDLLETQMATWKKQGQKFAGLINCAGIIDAHLFSETSQETADQLLQVNYRAQRFLMQAFFSDFADRSAIGVLNIVSSTGRCGSPLLADYGAANAALWTLSEAVAREHSGEEAKVMTFVAPAMHSPMQKRIGRTALRYFKMSDGGFNYSTAQQVAKEVLDCYFEKKEIHLSQLTRAKIFMNAIWPEFISRKIKKLWCKTDEI